MNPLAQIVHCGEMLFPMGIQHLKHHRLLIHPETFAAHQRLFVPIGLFQILQDTFAQGLFVQ